MRLAFAKQGGAGAKFRVQYEKLLKCLVLPKGAKEDLGIQGDEGMKEPDSPGKNSYDERDEEKDDE